MSLRWLTFVITALMSVSPAMAQEDPGPQVDTLDLEVHGFVSQGFLVSSGNNYLANSKDGSFEFAEVGITFTKGLTDDLRVGLQLFARDLGPIGRYNARVDWFCLDYRHSDWFGIRAGRVKLPFGLYNEYNDIDAGRTAVLLPQSLYPIQSREFLLAQTGIEVYGRLPLGLAGTLEYRLYGGTVLFEIEPQADGFVDNVQIPYVAGGRLLWETPLPGLRLGGSLQALRLEGDIHFEGAAIEVARARFRLGPEFTGRIEARVPVVLWVASAEYMFADLLLAAEYSRWRTDTQTDLDLYDYKNEVVQERAYVLASYRVNPWFQPGIYYALQFPDVDFRKGRERQQHDLAATLRFDLNSYWLLKLEGHWLYGTADLNRNLNEGKELARLTRRWALFLVKTTAYF